MSYKIKMAGIYMISYNEYYYIGMSVDIFGRWGSHYSDIKMKKHSSPELLKLWNNTKPEQWLFRVLEYVSLNEFKKEWGYKGKELTSKFRTHLLKKEREWMGKYSINWALNKDNKYYK